MHTQFYKQEFPSSHCVWQKKKGKPNTIATDQLSEWLPSQSQWQPEVLVYPDVPSRSSGHNHQTPCICSLQVGAGPVGVTDTPPPWRKGGGGGGRSRGWNWGPRTMTRRRWAVGFFRRCVLGLGRGAVVVPAAGKHVFEIVVCPRPWWEVWWWLAVGSAIGPWDCNWHVFTVEVLVRPSGSFAFPSWPVSFPYVHVGVLARAHYILPIHCTWCWYLTAGVPKPCQCNIHMVTFTFSDLILQGKSFPQLWINNGGEACWI